LLRTRQFALASGIFLAIALLVWAGLTRSLDRHWLIPMRVFGWISILHFAMLIRPRMRPGWYRALISLPGLWFMGGTWLAFPWAIVGAFGLYPYGWQIPYLLVALGLLGSLRNRRELVHLDLDGEDIGELARLSPAPAGSGDHLEIIQITDPHLGPFMSERRLHAICERAVERAPDLVAITGDLLTMESQGDPKVLERALAPLSALDGRVFACFGNHDHEARDTVETALASLGIELLVDAMTVAETRLGPIEIIGSDFHWRNRAEKLAALFDGLGPHNGNPRLLLLHDPGAFWHVPDGAADLTLSGHTHGGQLGLVSLGLSWTIVSATSKVPDHGLWGHGRKRLYVHRGTGHYGFPVRLGVPGEESLIRVRFSTRSSDQ
jgi:predicted MPP superfamily phosphohydrolase